MEIRGKRFVIFGGSGFIGSHVANLLALEPVKEILVFDKFIRREKLATALATGRVKVIDGDVNQAEQVADVMDRVDGVFHLAALPITSCAKMPRLCLEVNVLGTFNILEAAQKAGVKKIVFSSASSVYGDTSDFMDEHHPLNARTLYGASKIAAEYFLRAFYDMYGLEYVTLRYMNVYGPLQDGGVIISVLNRIKQNMPPIIHGDGNQSFDFVYVEDVARANILAMSSDVKDEVFNVGSGTETSINEVISILLELTGSSLKPIFEPTAEILMQRRVGSIEKARRLLGFQPQVNLREGLIRVLRSMSMEV